VVFNTVDLLHSSFQFWKNNVDGGGYQSYGESFGWVGPIERGTAYWFLQHESAGIADFSYEGYTPTQDFQLLIKAHKVAPYWIMFGTPFNSSIDCTKIEFLNTAVNVFSQPWVDAVTSKMIASKAFGFESNMFFEVGPSQYLPQKTDLEPWHGYWLLIGRPEELTITFPKP
jgi:hypothetical protein